LFYSVFVDNWKKLIYAQCFQPVFTDALAKSRTEPKMTVFQGRQTIHRREFVDSERNMTVSFPPDRSTLTFCEGIIYDPTIFLRVITFDWE